MENRQPPGDAREQLAALEGAVTAVKRGGSPISPWWYWFIFATAGPAVVALETQTDSMRRYGPGVVAAMLVVAVSAHAWRRMGVRPRRSVRSSPQVLATFLFTFTYILGLQLSSALADRWEAWVAAVVSFAVLAATTAFFGRRMEAIVWADPASGR